MKYNGGASWIQRSIEDACRYSIDKINAKKLKFVSSVTPIHLTNCQAKIDTAVRCDPSSGAMTVTMPSITSDIIGQTLVVKNVSSSTNTITVKVARADHTIDNAASVSIANGYGSIIAQCVGQKEWITLRETNTTQTNITYYYTVHGNAVRRKIGDASWSSMALTGSPSVLKYINGSSTENVWVCGQVSAGNAGYLAVDSGSGFVEVNSHPTFGTHPMVSGSNRIIHGVMPVSTSEIWTNTQDDSSGIFTRFHKWDPVNGWVEKFSISRYTFDSYRSFVKNGDVICIGATVDRLIYSLDAGENWASETTPFSSGGWIDVSANPSNSRFRALKKAAGGDIQIIEGIPAGTGDDAWTVINTYNGTAATQPSAYGKHVWCGQNGDTFALITDGANDYLVHGWDDVTPTAESTGDNPAGLHGTTASDVIFTDDTGGSRQLLSIWDGDSISTDDTGVANIVHTWAIVE